MRWRAALILLAIIAAGTAASATGSFPWPTYRTEPGPGGFATVDLEHPRHSQQIKGPNVVVRVCSGNPRPIVHVLLDGKVIGADGAPLPDQPSNLQEINPTVFAQSSVVNLPIRGMAPGVHSLEIIAASRGSSLPDTNEQRISFMVQ